MAAIDLRSTTIFIKDGSVGTITGVINHSGGYPIGTKVLAVTMSLAPTEGDFITFGSHMQMYTITSFISTTQISIYPALTAAVADTDPLAVGGHAIYAKIGEGNLTYNEKRNLVYIRDRGFINTVKLGDDEPMEVSLDFTWEFLRGSNSGTPPSFEEVFKQIGLAAGWTTTSVDTCEPYSTDILILNIPPCGSNAEKILLPEFRWTDFDHDLKGAKVAVKGSCNVLLATVTHSTSP